MKRMFFRKNDNGIKVSYIKKDRHIPIHFFMAVICFISVYAFLIVIGSSLQSQKEIYECGYRAIPKKISFEAYKYIFNAPKKIINAYGVTFITTVIGTVLGVWLTATYGYVISRRDYPYRNLLSIAALFTMLFSGGLVATYIVTTQWLRLYNNIWVLILPGMVTPWNIMLMKSFFSDISNEIIEAAKIDGAGEFKIFASIVLPMSKPVIAAISLFLALGYWNDYMQSLLYIESENLYKLQYLLMKILTDMDFLNSAQAADTGILDMMGGNIPSENARMAMCVIAAGPVLCIFPFFQKYFAKGLSLGSVKG